MKTFDFLVDEKNIGKRMDYFLLDRLNEDKNFQVSRKNVKKIIEDGYVFLNRARTKFTAVSLALNDNVTIKIRPHQLKQKEIHVDFHLNDKHVLYEDGSIIVINKPAGIPSQGTLDPTRDHLYAAVQRYLKARNPQREVYVGLHHRLDRDTSGVILMSKKKSVNKEIGDMFQNHEALKEYMAICHTPKENKTKERWVIKNYLDRSKEHRMKMTEVHSGGDLAITNFKLVKTYPSHMIVEAKPKTGRMHQIRVHLSGYGMHIVGDSIYTPKSLDDRLKTGAKRCLLHAYRLTFPHPVSKKSISVEAPPPEDFDIWLNSDQS